MTDTAPTSPMIRTRSPVLNWLLTLVTGGIYLYVWLYLMMKDINHLRGESCIPVKRIFGAIIPLILLYAVGFSFLVVQDEPHPENPPLLLPALLFINAVVVVSLFFYGLLKVRSELVRLGLKGVPSSVLIIATTLLYALSLPLLQSHLNRISKALKEPASAA